MSTAGSTAAGEVREWRRNWIINGELPRELRSTHPTKQWLGWVHVLLAVVVALQVAASSFYDEQASNTVWAFLNWFMAIGVLSAVAVSGVRWRGSAAPGVSARRSSTVLFAASILLLLLFFEQWRFNVAFFQAGGELLRGPRLLLWLVVDVLFVLINTAVGTHLLRGSRMAR